MTRETGSLDPSELDYREFLVSRIEGTAGTLTGQNEEETDRGVIASSEVSSGSMGIYSLNTRSLEKLYKALTQGSPVEDWQRTQ